MRLKQIISYYLFILVLVFLLLTVNSVPQSHNFAKASLVMDSFRKNSDNKITLGLLVKLEPEWHIYWRNSGDSGIPTKIDFSLPHGFTAAEVKFPIPKAFEFDGLVSYGYENQVLFISEISLPSKTFLKEETINVKLKSLICKDICIPFDTTLNVTINLNKDYKPNEETSNLFRQTISNLPFSDTNLFASASLESDKVYLQIKNPIIKKSNASSIYFLSYKNGYFLNSIHQKIIWADDQFELILEPDQYRTEMPKEVYGILITENADRKMGYEIKTPILSKENNH